MSETDDTDVLLLIPPDFFLVHSSASEDSLLESSRTVVHKPASCTAQVLGKLVDQVHSLESRLDSLEISTNSETFSSLGSRSRRKSLNSDSFDDRSIDRKCFTFPRRRRRKVTSRKVKQRELSSTSLDSASAYRTIPPLKLKDNKVASYIKSTDNYVNDSPSMDGDISSIVSTPSKKNDKLLLHEIDEFLTKVEAYESPETKHKVSETNLSPENVIKATSDYITHKLDSKGTEDIVKLPSGRTVPSNVLDKYIYLVKSNSGQATQVDRALPTLSHFRNQYNTESSVSHPSDITPKASQDIKNVQDTKSPSIRRLNFSDSKDLQPTSTPKRPPQPSPSHLDSFRPTTNKIYDRASKVLENYKSQNYSHTHTQSSLTDSYLPSQKREEFKMPQMIPFAENKTKLTAMQNKLMDTIDTDLLSLSELWGEKGDKLDKANSAELEEERLKREHCEAMIQQLQRKILEQQERLAVAIKVDRAKDGAIRKLREAWLKITGSLDKAEERHRAALEKMVAEVENFKMVADEAQKKTNHYEAELYKALDLAHDYQDKCKQVEIEKKEMRENTEKVLSNKDELIKSKEKEIEVLKENYETVMRLNKQTSDCLKNLEDSLEKERVEHEVTKSTANEMNRKIQTIDEQTSLLRQERDLLKEKVNEERARCSMLERQVCEQRDRANEMSKRCDSLDGELKALRKHLELQKNELKTHYQKQLEDAVLAKLQEFQQQLDHAEREMESDARTKENAIIDTYNKQMARVEDQHKLEINLLEEKQREEIKLYRLQLAQASEKIGLLENKLETYRRRRGQIASQLHGVMEAQWRQALLILTNGHPATPALDRTRPDTASTGIPEYAPSKVPPLTVPLAEKGAGGRRPDPDLFSEGLSDTELQHYVKLMLTKPVDICGGGDSATRRGADREPNEEPTSDRPDRDKRDKSAKRCLNASKPPWKA